MLHGVKFHLFIEEEKDEEPMYTHAFCLGFVHTSLHSNMNMHLQWTLGYKMNSERHKHNQVHN